MRYVARAATAAALTALVTAAPASAFRDPDGDKPGFDSRKGAVLPAFSAGEREAQAELRGEIGQETGQGRLDPARSGITVTGIGDSLTGARGGNREAIAREYLRANAVALGLRAADVDALELRDSYTSWEGTTHLTFKQVSGELESYDNDVRVNIAADGSIINVASAAIPDFGTGGSPSISAAEALGIASRNVDAPGAAPRAGAQNGPERATEFSNGAGASLILFGGADGTKLAWSVNTAGTEPDAYNVLVDARSGAVLARTNSTRYANDASVYEFRTNGAAVTRDLDPYIDPADGSQGLKGPLVSAWSDTTDDCSVDYSQYPIAITLQPGCAGPGAGEAVAPSAGTNFVYPLDTTGLPTNCTPFPCTWNPAVANSWQQNRNQTTTQTFYFVNKFNLHLAAPPIGFDDASRSFGPHPSDTTKNDPVIVNALDGAATGPDADHDNNANFGTPKDGTSPVMQMYLFKSPFRSIHSGDDPVIVYHEYAHGLSNRLVGNATGLNQFQPRAMGEAWSDWYAFDYVVGDGLVTDTAASGELDLDAFTTPTAAGHQIRSQALDCAVGASAAICPGGGTAGPGGYTLGDLGEVASTSNVHRNGEIWGETLWDLRTALGAAVTRRLVTDALRNSPNDPTFLQQRDLILAADVTAFGGAHRDVIWDVFAKRGMGWKATIGTASSAVTTEDFTKPALLEHEGIAYTDAAPGGDADGFAEPGETVRLTQTVRNPGPQTVTGTSGVLSSTLAPIVIDDAPQAFPASIAKGATGSNAAPFGITVPSDTSCGTTIPLTLTLTSDQGTAAASFPIKVGGVGPATNEAETGLALAIPDDSPAGVSTTVAVTAPGVVADVNVAVNVTHPYVGDLLIKLTAPNGAVVELSRNRGGTGNNLGDGAGDTVFDDQAATSITAVTSAQQPFVGSWRPEQPLSALNGQPLSGTWTLTVSDISAADVGTLNKFGVGVSPLDCTTSAASLPAVSTSDASGVTHDAAVLVGSVDPQGTATSYRFDHGTTTAYGSRTSVGDAGGGAVSAPTSGLSPSTTYHYRAVALRDGIVVARGADKTFTTTAGPPAPPSGGSAGSGGTPPPGGGSLLPPVRTPADANITFAKSAKALTVDSKGRFTFRFGARAGISGSTTFVAARKALKLGRKSFKVDGKGVAKVKYKLSKADLKKLKKKKSVKVTATVTSSSGEKAKRTFTLKAPKAKKKRR